MPSQVLFISCVSEEFKQHRLRLANQLGALAGQSFRITVQEDFPQGGYSLLEWLDQVIGTSDRVIHLVGECGGRPVSAEHVERLYARWGEPVPTPTPVRSYTQWEYWIARHHHKPVWVYARDLPPDSCLIDRVQDAHWVAVRGSGEHRKSFSDAFDLVREVFYDLRSESQQTPASLRKANNLLYVSLREWFRGRATFLKQLNRLLGELHFRGHERDPALMGATENELPMTSVVVCGTAGVGKTRAVIEYAHSHANRYVALLFVSADTPEQLDAQLAGLCGAAVLDLPAQYEKEQARQLAAVLTWLQQHPGWLLIIDNVDRPEAVAAVRQRIGPLQGAGQVLITSRVTAWSKSFPTLELLEFDSVEATTYLLDYTRSSRRPEPDDADAATQIAQDLGGLVLALEQAGAYLGQQRRPSMSLAEYRAIWKANYDRVWAWSLEMENQLDGYPRSVAVTWQTSFNQLSEAGRILLQRLAWLSTEPVPNALLAVPVPTAEPLDAGAALAALDSFSLTRPTATQEAFTIHRLIQLVTRRSQEADPAHQRQLEALNWVNAAFKGEPDDVRCWPVLEPLAPHARAVTSADYMEDIGYPAPTTRLLNQVGLFLNEKSQWREAEQLFRRALTIDEARFGSGHQELAVRLSNLALLLEATNRWAEAESLMRQALLIDEANSGPDHPHVARSLNNLAGLLKATNRWDEAEPLYRRALAIKQANYASDHPIVATAINNLAQLFHATNRLTDAEPLMREALVIYEGNYGADHPRVALCLNNLAQLLQATNRWREAEPLYRRALVIQETWYGLDHPTVAIGLGNLAHLLHDTNRWMEAEPLYRRALAIDEVIYGTDHPNVAIRLSGLARLLRETSRLADAEPLLRRALAIDEASYGPNHPAVAGNLIGLARLFQETDRMAEAEPLLRRALAINEASYGPNHPEVAAGLSNLVGVLFATNRLSEAESLQRRALAIDEASYGPAHPTVAVRLHNLATLLYVANSRVEAELLFRRALVIDETSYGSDHPNVAIRLLSLTRVLQETDRLHEAEPLLRRALAINEASYGPDHPEVAKCLSNLSWLLRDTNRWPEAESVTRRALNINETIYGPNHPSIAGTLHDLAVLLRETDRLSEAELLLHRALAIDEASKGVSHPTVAQVLNSLAKLLGATNRLAEAELFMRRALAIDEACLGFDHPRVAHDLDSLAGLLTADNRRAEAEPLMRRALQIDENAFGPSHSEVAVRLANLALLLWNTNRLADAEPLMRRALEVSRKRPNLVLRPRESEGLELSE